MTGRLPRQYVCAKGRADAIDANDIRSPVRENHCGGIRQHVSKAHEYLNQLTTSERRRSEACEL